MPGPYEELLAHQGHLRCVYCSAAGPVEGLMSILVPAREAL